MKHVCVAAFVFALTAAPAAAQIMGPVAPSLTTEQVKLSESLALKYDESAAREHTRLATFADRPLGGAISSRIAR